MRLTNRIAAVTGSGSGMGRAVAQRLATEGAHVYVVDLNADAAASTAKLIAEEGGTATPVRVDVTARADLDDLFADIDQEHGVLHVLHNHVGMPGPAGLDISDEEWERNINVNMRSAFNGVAASFDLLKKAEGKASIILTASTSAIVGSPFSPLYSMTKAALPGFARAVALAGAEFGIRVNTICPGPVDTPMLPQFFGRDPGANIQDLMDNFISLVPLGRPAQPEEIASVVAFLASDDAAMITGHTLPIDGGLTIK